MKKIKNRQNLVDLAKQFSEIDPNVEKIKEIDLILDLDILPFASSTEVAQLESKFFFENKDILDQLSLGRKIKDGLPTQWDALQ